MEIARAVMRKNKDVLAARAASDQLPFAEPCIDREPFREPLFDATHVRINRSEIEPWRPRAELSATLHKAYVGNSSAAPPAARFKRAASTSLQAVLRQKLCCPRFFVADLLD